MSIEELNVNLKMIRDDIEVVDIFSIGGKYQSNRWWGSRSNKTSIGGEK